MITYDEKGRAYLGGTRLTKRGERVLYVAMIVGFVLVTGLLGGIE